MYITKLHFKHFFCVYVNNADYFMICFHFIWQSSPPFCLLVFLPSVWHLSKLAVPILILVFHIYSMFKIILEMCLFYLIRLLYSLSSKVFNFSESCSIICHGGVDGKVRYSTYSFLTIGLDGESAQRHSPATLPLVKGPQYPLVGHRD